MKTRKWYAWNDLTPPKPDYFHVTGEVLVANPGIQGELLERVPQGFNPSILLLDLHLTQRPGIWAQQTTWAQCRYDSLLITGWSKYAAVEIHFNGNIIVTIQVDEIH